MINEYSASQRRVFRVNPQKAGALDVTVEERVAHSVPRNQPGTNTEECAIHRKGVDSKVMELIEKYVLSLFCLGRTGTDASDRGLVFTSCYAGHVFLRGAAGALAMRTALLKVGFHSMIANLLSPILSLLAHRLFRHVIADWRTRIQRRLPDMPLPSAVCYGGIAASLLSILEVLIASGRVGRTLGRLIIAFGAALSLSTTVEISRSAAVRYVSGQAALALCPAPSAALVRSIGRDFRRSCDVCAGVTGFLACVAVPRGPAVRWTTFFSLVSALAAFAAARSAVDRRLSVVRLERCLGIFMMAMQRDGGLLPLSDTALSVTRIAGEEGLLTPPLPPWPPRVPITFGDSLYSVLRAVPFLTSLQKIQVVQQAEECLAARGIALLYNQPADTYHVLFAGQLSRDSALDTATLATPSGGPHENTPRFAAASLLTMKEVWAYFYTFVHHANEAKVVLPPNAETSPSPQLHVISGLEADGTLLVGKSSVHPFDFSLTRTEAQQRVASGHLDPLFPQFVSFVDAVVLGGWRVDHIRLPTKGWGIAVHFL